MNTVRFTYEPPYGYKCDQPGEQSGEYVRLDESYYEDWQEVVRLLEYLVYAPDPPKLAAARRYLEELDMPPFGHEDSGGDAAVED